MTVLQTLRGDDGVELLTAAGPGWRACLSTRLGGVSRDPFAGLNTSFTVGDDERYVRENRARLAAVAGFDAAALVVGRQVHGVRVAAVTAAHRGRGAEGQDSALADTDGLLTDVPGLPLLVCVADCVPVVMAAQGEGRTTVAVVHAGWRGMHADIVARAALLLRQRGRFMAAVVGPSIGPCCFTVGDETGRAFEERFPGTWRGGRVDLWAAAERQLAAAGLRATQVHNPRLCTVCDRRFFSHRRDQGRTGRQAAVVWVTGGSEAVARPQDRP